MPAQLLSELHQTESTGEPAPVLVYLRRPQESVLERFFEDSPACGDATFRVVQDAAVDAVVVYLESAAEGYTYDARRSGPEELSMVGSPQGVVRRAGEGWVTATP